MGKQTRGRKPGRTYSEFVGVRLQPAERKRLGALAGKIGKTGNLSAALRWLIHNAPDPRTNGGSQP